MGSLRVLTVCAALSWSAFPADAPADLFQAIRTGDVAYLKTHAAKDTLELRDRRGATPLMHAAAFGNLETLRLLLDRGAAVNAANDFGATALLWSARDPEKARLLIEHGAGVNAASKQGRTPLMLASLRPGGAPTVALLLAKGADPKLADTHGNTALLLAATIGEADIMRLLLARGADPAAPNDKGETPLICATKSHSAEAVHLLLQRNVNVNVANTGAATVKNGRIALIGLAPLHRAAAFGPVEMVTDLLHAGAEVNVRDSRGLTPLMFAVAVDHAQPEIVRTLLGAHADPNLKDNTGETALDWAAKFGNPEVLASLRAAGARSTREYEAPKRPDASRPNAATALSRSMALLEKTGAEFFRQSGCVGCHHQPMIARARFRARAAGFDAAEAASHDRVAQLKGQWISSQEEFLQSINPGGGPNRLVENLLGLEAAGYAPDGITDAAVIDVAESQSVDGRFMPGDEHPRPPQLESSIGSTARSIRALLAYTIPARRVEFTARVERASVWLQHAVPVTADEHATRLLGLVWASAPPAAVQAAARAVAALQRDDGGWAPNPDLHSDAFATGEVLTALAESGMPASDPAYRRGVDYLLSTQFPDGAWHVRSRALKFQPYFESGFPFGHDQWISTAATSWAVQALAHSVPSQRALAQ